MSNRLFQGIIHQTREAIDRTVGVIDETMTIIACIGVPLVLVYHFLVYRSFKGRLKGDY